MRTKTILAAVAATLIAAVGVTAPALGAASDAGKTVVTPMMNVGSSGSICC